MEMDKIKSGIPGLDDLIDGGFKKNSSILITGPPGSGKTIMGLQFVYFGAKNYDEPGIFISTEENLEDLKRNAKDLGMDIEQMEKRGKLFVYEKKATELRGGIVSIKGLLDAIKSNNVQRVVLDSLIFFKYLYPRLEDIEFRREVYSFIQKIKRAGVTFIAVSEKKSSDLEKLEFDMMDFLFEGFIVMSNVKIGSFYERVLTVPKIRGQEHSLGAYPIKIESNKGLKVLVDQKPFSIVKNYSSKKPLAIIMGIIAIIIIAVSYFSRNIISSGNYQTGAMVASTNLNQYLGNVWIIIFMLLIVGYFFYFVYFIRGSYNKASQKAQGKRTYIQFRNKRKR